MHVVQHIYLQPFAIKHRKRAQQRCAAKHGSGAVLVTLQLRPWQNTWRPWQLPLQPLRPKELELETILMVPAPPKGTNLRDAIISVERLFTDYEATSHEVLSEHVKIAALWRLLPPEIKVHVNMLVKDTTTYADVNATVTEYEVAERRYTPLKEASVYDHTSGAAPMDVDQVQASKGGRQKENQGARVKAPKGINPRCAIIAERHAKGSAGIRMENPTLGPERKRVVPRSQDQMSDLWKDQPYGGQMLPNVQRRWRHRERQPGHCTGDRSDGDGSPTARSGYIARDRVEGDINRGEILQRGRSGDGADRLWQS